MHKLIKRAQRGDDIAFMTLFSQYEEQLYRIAYLHVKNEQHALDVMQETAYRAFKNIRQIKSPEYFKTWLTRIAINCAIDHIRKDRSILHFTTEIIENSSSYSTSEEAAILEKVLLEDIMTILTPEEKNVVILKYYDNCTFREISEICSFPLGTVKSILYRALGKLKDAAKEEQA